MVQSTTFNITTQFPLFRNVSRIWNRSLENGTLPRHQFGAELELVDDECEDSVTTLHRDDPPQNCGANTEPNIVQDDSQNEPELVRRYPTRVRCLVVTCP